VRAVVLGSGAGGGVPQWNCACAGCVAARSGLIPSRTQDSVCTSADGERWVLLNASPDVRVQLERTRELHPTSKRGTPIRAIILTNADVDHVLGLFVLRESEPIVVWCTRTVRAAIEANVLVKSLQRTETQLTWREIPEDKEFDIEGLTVRAFPVPGKPPIYLSQLARSPDENIGLKLHAKGRALAYVSGAGGPGQYLERVRAADKVLFDGTFWSSDELVQGGLGYARAEEMAHWPIGGEQGSLQALSPLRGRLVYTHINNTNPILLPSSVERSAVESAGFDIAYDGMTLRP
jgi:pyrroloquinoline quinone biosynthesis protein B